MLFRRLFAGRHLVLCATLLGAGLSTGSAFAVSDAERAGARAAANQGADAFDQGKWADAVELFSRAEALVHSPIHLSYIARAQLKQGHWVEAYEVFNRISREQPEPPVSKPVANAIEDAKKQLATLDAQLPYVTVNLKGVDASGATTTMDGVTLPPALLGVPHPVNPGVHKFRASSAAQASKEVTLDLKPSARQTVELVLTASQAAVPPPVPLATAPASNGSPAPTPASTEQQSVVLPPEPSSDKSSSANTMRIGGYVALGVGVVGVGLGTVFLLSASSKQKQADDAFQACGGKACPAADRTKVDGLDSDAASGKTLALTSFLIGGIGAATGVTLLVLSGKGSNTESAAHISPYVGYRSLGLSGTF